jgi:hypothetical protein
MEMQKVRMAQGFLLCWFVAVAITLFLAAPATAEWTDPALDSMLILDTEISVLGPSSDPNFRGLVEIPVFDQFGDQQEQVYVGDIVKIEATLEVKPEMPLPMQIRVIFGAAGYQSARRDWTLRYPGTYSTRTYFLVSSEGEKTIGLKAWVRWLPVGESQRQVDSIVVTDPVLVEPLP